MNKKLYNLMDWAAIEEIVYGESSHPENILGAKTKGNNTLLQCFFPGAVNVTIKITKGTTVEEIKMEKADEEGFYAALIPGKEKFNYIYKVEYKSGKKKIIKEFPEIYKSFKTKSLGAEPGKLDGITGCYFSVFAPNAIRVSLLGKFNTDDRFLQMIKDDKTGIFSLFVPGLTYNDEYYYSILAKGNEKLVRLDPYSYEYNKEYDMTKIIKTNNYKWSDESYIKNRSKENITQTPVSIYEADLAALPDKVHNKDFINYLKEMNYTHIELMPIFESLNELSAGCDAGSYFAIARKLGSRTDLYYFVDKMHKAGIGVIVQLPFASFAKSKISFNNFDGEAIYEYDNPSRRIDPVTGRLFFNYSQEHVVDLLKTAVDVLINEFHIDGFKMLDLASMLYLDYHKDNYEPNINGENLHLEAIEFIKSINKFIHNKKNGLFTIAEDLSSFPRDTMLNIDSLGFDFTINYGLHNDSLRYITLDPIERKNHHELITRSGQYFDKENYINTISHYDVDGLKGGLISKMPGDIADKFANLKVFLGYLYTMPGKKSLFMGQDIAEFDSFSPLRKIQFDLIDDYPNHKNINNYVKALNNLYKNNTEFNSEEKIIDSFKFINDTSSETNVLSFIRKSKNSFKLIVINFANCSYDKYKIGVPEKGKYETYFTTDDVLYGGSIKASEYAKYKSRLDEADGFDSSIRINLSPLSINIFSFSPYTDKELQDMAKKKAAREKRVNDRIKANNKFLSEKLKIREELKKDYNDKIAKALSELK